MDAMSQTPVKRQSYVPNRSCERCRSLKIRCLPTESSASSACQRCARLHADCVYALPAKRRPRKRTDTKVAQLEKEVRALSSILRKQRESTASSSSSPSSANFPGTWENSTPDSSDLPLGAAVKLSTEPTSPYNTTPSAVPALSPDDRSSDSSLDVIDSGLISYPEAKRIFDFFAEKIAPRFPVVAFAPDATVDSYRKHRPLLFLAVLATGSVSVNPVLCCKLHKQLASILAQQSMVAGSKSLDLLQALLVTTVWYFPEQTFDQLKYQQYAHMIAGIGSQLRIGGRSKSRRRDANRSIDSRGVSPKDQQAEPTIEFAAEKHERQRTLISCYLLCAGISRSMHRPTIFSFARWMDDFLDQLETSPFVASTDKQLSLWIRLQRIMTEASTALGVDDPSTSIDLSELRVQHTIQTYDAQLDQWYSKFMEEEDEGNDSLRFVFSVNRVFLHEIALYSDHDPDDFKPPFTIDRIARPVGRKLEWTPAHVQSLSACWSNACEALDIFLGLPVAVLRTCPDITFIRLVYCVVILVKLSMSIGSRNSTLPSGMPFADESQYDRIISFIERLVQHLNATDQGGMCPIAAKFGRSLKQMKNWCARQRRTSAVENLEESLLEPLKDLNLDDKSEESDVPEQPHNHGSDARHIEGCSSNVQCPTSRPRIFGQELESFSSELYQDNQLGFHVDWDCNYIGDFDPTFGFDMDPIPGFGYEQGHQLEISGNDFDTGELQWADVGK